MNGLDDPFILLILLFPLLFPMLSLRPHEDRLQVNGIEVSQNAQLDVALPHPVFQTVQVNVTDVADSYGKDHDFPFDHDVTKGHVAYRNAFVSHLHSFSRLDRQTA